LPPLSSRPALYGSVLNGSKENFFNSQKANKQRKHSKSYLNVMRKIRSNIFPKVESQVKAVKTTRTAKITFALNASLCQQAEN